MPLSFHKPSAMTYAMFQGNVEYKLQLIDPTPERFPRLVTQLKWRLLEGGGQAYYELGVADSGQLVGLTRENLERSLATLECMAGEIGASVIVVKEIDVPSRVVGEVMRIGRLGGTAVGGVKKKSFRTRPTEWGAVEILPSPSSKRARASRHE